MTLNFSAPGMTSDVAVLSDGSIVVTWSAGPGTGAFSNSQSIYAQRFSAAGDALTGPILVSNQFESGLPEVMATADGGFIVASRDTAPYAAASVTVINPWDTTSGLG